MASVGFGVRRRGGEGWLLSSGGIAGAGVSCEKSTRMLASASTAAAVVVLIYEPVNHCVNATAVAQHNGWIPASCFYAAWKKP